MRRSRLVLALPALSLVLTGCLSQPQEANDTPPFEVPSLPPSVFQTPAPVETAPLTVDPPGPTRTP